MNRLRGNLAKTLFAVAGLLASGQAAFAGLVLSAPVDVIGNLSGTQFQTYGYGTLSYKDWGNEPSVTVNPLNPNQIVVSSFAYGTNATGSGANIFYSTNGGTVWNSEFSVPAPSNGTGVPNDWRFVYDNSGLLHGGILGGCGNCNVFHGSTGNPTSLAAWSYSGGGAQINSAASTDNADQPWIAVSGKNVYVAYDDFHAGTGMRVAASHDGGVTFTVDSAINNGPVVGNTVNPGTRIATDGVGNVYAIFGVGPSAGTAGVHNVTYYLNRSHDGGATWDFNGSSVVGGMVIDSGVSTQLCNACNQANNNWFANVNDLRGNVTAIAADAAGKHVYALIGKRDANGTDRVYLVSYATQGNGSLLQTNEIVVSPSGMRAALPSLTVKADGTVVYMYETYNARTGKVEVHVGDSVNFGASVDADYTEYSFTPLSLLAATGSPNDNREFGDYVFLTSVGNRFYGAFAGLGNVNNGNGVDTTGLIDPFFFTGVDVPEPASIAVFAAAVGGLYRLRRRSGSKT